MDAIIVGAGIGGLTTALALEQLGIRTTVYEAAREVRELGVGINVLPHANKVFDALEVMDRVVAAGVETRELRRCNKQGKTIFAEARGRDAGYHWPQVSIHRGRLQRVLYDAVRERLGEDSVVTGHRFDSFEQADGRITARFADSTGGLLRELRTADLLIAADGIHSRARSLLFPDEGAPVYAGIAQWRGVTRAKPFLGGATMAVIGYNEQKFVVYPVTKPEKDGLCLINWICELDRPDMLAREDWSRPGKLEDFFPAYEDWVFDWINVPALIQAADAIYEFPMVDRNPLPHWSVGRLTLLGDAAHPMYPVGSNGASQAILDADALSTALAEHPNDAAAALAAYEAARRGETAKIVEAHRTEAKENMAQIVERLAPEGFEDISEVMSPDEITAMADRFRTTVGFDRDTVNRGRRK